MHIGSPVVGMSCVSLIALTWFDSLNSAAAAAAAGGGGDDDDDDEGGGGDEGGDGGDGGGAAAATVGTNTRVYFCSEFHNTRIADE